MKATFTNNMIRRLLVLVSFVGWTAALQAQTSEVRIPVLEDPAMADQTISLNFNEVEIRSVLKTIGDITGINFVPDPKVRGNVTIMSPTEVPIAELFPVLQSILEVHGYTAIASGNLVKVVPKEVAVNHHLPVRYGADPNTIPMDDSMVTQIMPLAVAQAGSLEQMLKPLLASPGATLNVYANTNTLVLTDTSANIHRIATLIERIDRHLAEQRPQVFALHHVAAAALCEQIQTIVSQTPQTKTTNARTAQVTRDTLNIIADSQSNSLIVTANEPTLAFVSKLVEQLDVPLQDGRENIKVIYLNNADPNEVSKSLNSILSDLGRLSSGNSESPTIKISADAGTNALVIQAPSHEFATIESIVDKLDVVREQIFVEMQIVEVSEDDLVEMGVDWTTMDEVVSSGVRGFASSTYGISSDYLNGNLDGLGVGMWRSIGGNTTIGAILHLLEQESKVNILSKPHLIASNHRKASIIVGENRAFVTKANITETTDSDPTVIKSYEYKDVGITLEMTPHVSKSGTVRLELFSEFTKLVQDVANLSSDTPATAKREVKTMISMQSGETTVIGGLIRDDTDQVEQKIPLLGDLPLIGALFKSQSTQVTKTNLLIFITPHVLKTAEERLQMTQVQQQRFEQANNIQLIVDEAQDGK